MCSCLVVMLRLASCTRVLLRGHCTRHGSCYLFIVGEGDVVMLRMFPAMVAAARYGLPLQLLRSQLALLLADAHLAYGSPRLSASAMICSKDANSSSCRLQPAQCTKQGMHIRLAASRCDTFDLLNG